MRAISILFFFVIAFIISLVLIVFGFINKIINFIFGTNYNTKFEYKNETINQRRSWSKTTENKKKIIDNSEGEYVEFEEVK